MLNFIDTHCHLDARAFDENRAQIVQTAQDYGVKWQIVPSTNYAAFDKTLAVCEQFHGVFPALGLHPYWISEHQESDLIALDSHLQKNPKIVAIGECGLDLWMENADINKQQYFFESQCAMAEKYDLPLIMHARKALDLLTSILSKYPKTQGIVHSFSGSLQQAQKLIERGFLLGFGGAMTYERAQRLRKLVQELPAYAIVIETDSPDQGHVNCKNRPHEPKDLIFIAQEIANLRTQSLAEIATINTENIQRIFKRISISS